MNLGLNINKLLDTIFSKSTQSDGIFCLICRGIQGDRYKRIDYTSYLRIFRDAMEKNALRTFYMTKLLDTIFLKSLEVTEYFI